MRSDVMVERLESPEIPAFEVTVQITQCQNRFEILAKPGVELDSWALQAILAKWIDARKLQGHNLSNSI